MTERDYINIRDLSNVMHAAAMVREICIENQPNIPPLEYMDVLGKIYSWRDSLFEVAHKSQSK